MADMCDTHTNCFGKLLLCHAPSLPYLLYFMKRQTSS